MRYSIEIKKFLYSQYFFGGLRMAIGVSLPAVLCLIVFRNTELGFTIATGALGACVVDMPGPLKYKHNEMLICSVLGFASACGGIPELIDDGVTGYLVPKRDPAAIADRVLKLLADPSLRKQMGEAARRKAEAEFDLRKVVSQILREYRIDS